MKIEILGQNIEITPGIQIAIENTLGELDNYFRTKDYQAKILVKQYPVGTKVEISLKIKDNQVIRQDAIDKDTYRAIDLAGKSLEKQIRKINQRLRLSGKKQAELEQIFTDTSTEHEETIETIMRRKMLKSTLMTEEEAVLQFELSGHDFYVYEDAEDERFKVIYRRRDGQYGIIEIEK